MVLPKNFWNYAIVPCQITTLLSVVALWENLTLTMFIASHTITTEKKEGNHDTKLECKYLRQTYSLVSNSGEYFYFSELGDEPEYCFIGHTVVNHGFLGVISIGNAYI